VSEHRHLWASAPFALALCCGACAADADRLPARGFLGSTAIDTTVDSELARYFIERQAPGAKLEPAWEAFVQAGRAEVRGPRAGIALTQIAREVSPDFATLLLSRNVGRG
jgi:hypothetical protein